MDIDMNLMNGLAAARMIHKDYSGAWIMLMRNHPPEMMEKAADAAGANMFVRKEDLEHPARLIDGR